MFVGEKLVLYGVLERETGDEKEKSDSDGDKIEVHQSGIELQASIEDETEPGNQKEVKHFIRFELKIISGGEAKSPFIKKSEEVSLHQIAAKSYIQEKQNQMSSIFDVTSTARTKEAVIKVSRAAGVICKFTAFVAVDEDTHHRVTSAMQQRPWGSAMATEISELKFIMSQNIAEITERNERLSGLDERADCLNASSSRFFKSAKKSAGWFSFPSLSLPSFCISSLFGSSGSSAAKDERDPKGQRWDFEEVDTHVKSISSPSDQTKQLRDPLMELVTLQRAAGYWEFTEELAKLCGSSKAELLGAYPRRNKAASTTEENERAWATALALVLLKERFLTRKGEWEMVAEKGKTWLKANLLSNDNGFDDFLAFASKAL